MGPGYRLCPFLVAILKNLVLESPSLNHWTLLLCFKSDSSFSKKDLSSSLCSRVDAWRGMEVRDASSVSIAESSSALAFVTCLSKLPLFLSHSLVTAFGFFWILNRAVPQTCLEMSALALALAMNFGSSSHWVWRVSSSSLLERRSPSSLCSH